MFSIAYSMQKERHSCIKQVKESIKYEKEESNLFTCYTILTYCYNKLDDKEKSIYYRDKAIANIEKNKDNLTKARFYEISADIAKKEGNQNEEIL